MDKALLLAELKNAIFPSKESDGIEHVDMPYSQFIGKLEALAAETVGKPQGMATVVEETAPMDNFPNHDENLTS